MLFGGFGESDVEGRRETDGQLRGKEPNEAIERNRAPWIEGKKEVALIDFLGDGGSVKNPRQLMSAHFDFDDRAQREIGKEDSAKARHADKGKT